MMGILVLLALVSPSLILVGLVTFDVVDAYIGQGEMVNKLNKFLIVWIAITFICSSWFYHTNKMKALQAKYEKTCELSVKKSEKISQLVKELKELK